MGGAGRSITQGRLSLGSAGQWILPSCDCLRARFFDLLRLDVIELDVFREFWREVHVGIDGVYRTYLHTCHAIDAFIGVNDHLVLHFVEARDRADFYTVGELTSVTFFGDDMGHWISIVESCVKKTAVTSN